jgi:ribulose 1,5-bisphosphate synthetase/thiazole synthase
LGAVSEAGGRDVSYDVVVYGGTSGGVVAAIQAARMGKSVVLVEPGRHLGGLTSGGLGATDIGNKAAIGGIAREFYRRVANHYARDDAWTNQKRSEYLSTRQHANEDTMWTFEPHVAEEIYRAMIHEAGVPVVFADRLVLGSGVTKQDNRITTIRLESGKAIQSKMFIDASYEGDLMAGARVSYHVGREGNDRYGETINGVQVHDGHQFTVPVDPYVVPGDLSSGLLPGIQPGPLGKTGEGDTRVQAYNFRMCMTDVPKNRIPWPKPEGYHPLRYELLLRYINAGGGYGLGAIAPMPNRKTDTNNAGAVSTDNIGMNYGYPDGDYTTREAIFREHVTYQQGMMWFLANDPRVPEKIRRDVGRWGLCKDEFVETGGWPHQLYVREARRMISDHVMTQHNCQRKTVVDDPVGLAAYTMDSHNCRRFVDDQGHARNEGNVEVGGFPPYPIAYRSIVPKEAECTNLLVPVCLSASHIAYGSIRMEPVFRGLGQSAATAAAHAIDRGLAVQQIDGPALRKRLREDGQVLEWTAPARNPAVRSR